MRTQKEKSSKMWEMLPYLGMVMVECLDVGMTTLSKSAMSKGMSHFVFVVYSNALATLILFPSSFIIHRTKRQPIKFSLLCKFFLLSLVGIAIMQNCVFTGISYSSPTLGSALSQLVPAFTFLLAVIFRLEKVDLRSSKSQIKILGTVVSISGALIVTFYKGPPIFFTNGESHSEPTNSSMSTNTSSWVIGGLFLAAASLCLSVFNTFQATILKEYPSELFIISFYCLFGTIQSAVITLIAEKTPNAWMLNSDIEYISVVYSAVCGSVLTYGVLTWCIHKKGPVFVAMFKPLSIAIAAFLGAIFLGDTLHLGSIIGAVVIVAGFYGVIWAQNKEDEEATILINTQKQDKEDEEAVYINTKRRSQEKTPLLHQQNQMDV